MSLQDTLKFSNDFVEDVLEKETWFSEMLQLGDCDLLLLTGTHTEGTADQFSDIDIFLVCPYESQKKHKLKPVQVFDYENMIIEVSVLATEKLFDSQSRKSEIHWWHHCYVIKSYDKDAEQALSLASTLTHKELLDRLWTNFIYFKINTLDI